MSMVSLLLFIIWFGYEEHVNPYVQDSIKRAQEIEKWINYLYGAEWMRLKTARLSQHRRGMGTVITCGAVIINMKSEFVRILIAIFYGQ
jgi:hypothetical protein